jgi:predicted DNA-binding transcriptional regulator AlpA
LIFQPEPWSTTPVIRPATTSPSASAEASTLPLLLGAKQAAALPGLGVSTWLRLVAAKKAPASIKVGGSTRWRRTDILAWIEAGCPAVA